MIHLSTRRAIVRMLKQGYTLRRIADDLQISYTDVHDVAHEAHIRVKERTIKVRHRSQDKRRMIAQAKKMIADGVDPAIVRANFGDVM